MQFKKEDYRRFLLINRGIKESTIKTYLNRFEIFIKWLKEKDLQISKHTVSLFLYEKKTSGLSNSAVNTYRHMLAQLDAYYAFNDLPHGFVNGFKSLPKTHPNIEILTEEELKNLLSAKLIYKNRNGSDCNNLDFKYSTFTKFLAFTGCRINEACTLKIKHLDIGQGKALLIETKNNTTRHIHFGNHTELKDSLTQLINDRNSEELVFTGSTGNRILPGVYNDDLRKRAKTAGITKWERIHAHILRHTFASQLLSAGVDITIVSKLLGHKDIRVTFETYIHILDNTLQRAINKHPLLREYTSLKEIVEDLKETINKFNFHQDSRFKFIMVEDSTSLKLDLQYNDYSLNVKEL